MKKVLYIEDCIDTQEAIKDYFNNYCDENIEFTCVGTAKDGLTQLESNTFHAIILDVHLPNESKNDAFLNKQISILKKEKDIPLIVFTGLHKYIETVGKTDLNLDFDEWITKPRNLHKLKNTLMAYL